MSEPTLVVSKIRAGTVIDHIPAGRALDVLKIIGLSGREGTRTAIIMNVESKKLGKKDIVKIEGKFLGQHEVSIIALIAPTATINIVEDFKVVRKFKVEIPEVIEEIIICPNTTCITNKSNEPIKSRFRVLSRKPITMQCSYCSTLISEDDLYGLIKV
ncbi:MAG: aspartate carbamoyltransferase regulatory subunit [Sulfolobales archaeon]|nr:aspartate carbamoyltransferase regulatory subunit [Sulfolobales archaeon]MCX8199344.1 aspartate carbamoyltransferase regulatory subunit [Sulfolobales archaeon]MDW8170342.1 aspartate carbamoyltransferase regulatory subunit [Desulfurococcaceae archaeon]